MEPFLCFDAVVFDLDGTLIATDRFWIRSAERGARRALGALGLTRELPTAAEWLSLVGLPLEVGFRTLFPELTQLQRAAVQSACVEEEEAELRATGVPAMAGAREVVRALHARGVALGIASNCQRNYLDHMLDGLELRPLLRAAYCRESPGITSKGDMLARFVGALGSRAVVMVGDRASDRDAAWENGLPHVHCAFGFAQGDEDVESEGRIAALEDLPGLLERRGSWIEAALTQLGVLDGPARTLGITGTVAAGKSLFARHAARILAARGRPAVVVSMADYVRAGARGGDSWGAQLDLERLEAELLEPHGRGREVALGADERVPPGATLVLEGPWLLGQRERLGLDRLVYLDVAETPARRRVLGRAGPAGQGEAWGRLERLREQERSLARRHPPSRAADLVLDGSNPLGLENPTPPFGGCRERAELGGQARIG